MVQRLNQLLECDRDSRWRIIVVSSAAIAIWGFISELAGDSVHEAQIKATVLGALIFGVQVIVYCARESTSTVVFNRTARISRRLVTLGTATLLLAAIPAPIVEAAVLDRRLRMLTRGRSLSPAQAKDVGSALAVATAARIKLPDATRVRVYQAIKSVGLTHPESQAVVTSANEIVRYSREVTFTPTLDRKPITGSPEAKQAYSRGLQDAMQVLQSAPSTLVDVNTARATEAVTWLSRAITLARGHAVDVLIGALTMRATMYLELRRPNDALRDAERLEAVGCTDLSAIIGIEGVARLLRGTREDLEVAVRLFTLAIYLDPPAWEANQSGALLFVDAFGNRAKAYYGLGQFENSLEDSKRMLELLTEHHLLIPYYVRVIYLQIIASNLQLGNVEQARMEAAEWLRRTGDSLAAQMISQLDSRQFDRRRWLEEYAARQ